MRNLKLRGCKTPFFYLICLPEKKALHLYDKNIKNGKLTRIQKPTSSTIKKLL